jgi:hypothetical protein
MAGTRKHHSSENSHSDHRIAHNVLLFSFLFFYDYYYQSRSPIIIVCLLLLVATLGIVEFGVFLLQKYYQGLDKERKDVFGDVHFALFYTAIFNAFQSVLLAMVVTRTSDRLWVQTEQVELSKYVRIREAFEKTQAQLYDDLEYCNGNDNVWNWKRYTPRRLWKSLRHPGLRQKYMKLLVQVRFHQLRIQFLEGNDLPLNFKVSEYLKRSEQGIMHHLVHVSEVAWLLLTGGLNLIYFLMGMVAHVSKDQVTVGTSLTSIFFGSMFFFIFMSWILYVKMRNIFRKIMYVCVWMLFVPFHSSLRLRRILLYIRHPPLLCLFSAHLSNVI